MKKDTSIIYTINIILIVLFIAYKIYNPTTITNQDFKVLILGKDDLEYSTAITRQNSNRILHSNIENDLERNGNLPKDVAIFENAKAIQEKANNLCELIEMMQKNIFDYKQINQESDSYYFKQVKSYLNKGKDENFDKLVDLTKFSLSEEKRKTLNIKELYQKIIEFQQFVKSKSNVTDTIILTNLNGKLLNFEEFEDFNFNTKIAIAISNLARIEADIAVIENIAISNLSTTIGSVFVKFDNYQAIISAESDELEEGMTYVAKMFLVPISPQIKPTMRSSHGLVEVGKNGVGKISFVVPSTSDFNERGIAKRKWQGAITIKKANGDDTTFKFDQEYYILKKSKKIQ